MIVNTNQLRSIIPDLKCGDRILLSGTVYTARDAAHKKLVSLLENGEPLPFPIEDSVVYYAGPTERPPNMPIGSCGPTTSSRMDLYAPKLLDLGLSAMIGKGPRNNAVIDAIIRNKAIYLCALGGAGALAARCIKSSEVVAFESLGCESVKKLEFDNFPLIVGIDCFGNSIF